MLLTLVLRLLGLFGDYRGDSLLDLRRQVVELRPRAPALFILSVLKPRQHQVDHEIPCELHLRLLPLDRKDLLRLVLRVHVLNQSDRRSCTMVDVLDGLPLLAHDHPSCRHWDLHLNANELIRLPLVLKKLLNGSWPQLGLWGTALRLLVRLLLVLLLGLLLVLFLLAVLGEQVVFPVLCILVFPCLLVLRPEGESLDQHMNSPLNSGCSPVDLNDLDLLGGVLCLELHTSASVRLELLQHRGSLANNHPSSPCRDRKLHSRRHLGLPLALCLTLPLLTLIVLVNSCLMNSLTLRILRNMATIISLRTFIALRLMVALGFFTRLCHR
mmetsp:Transcript_27146/g.88734  ORF Transcript_27146/g.88734 Transcript_27146/m.88734 type:complete len:327 (+) Transcript_27146:1029-2009(+)